MFKHSSWWDPYCTHFDCRSQDPEIITKLIILKRIFQDNFKLKGTVSVILSNPECKDDNTQFNYYIAGLFRHRLARYCFHVRTLMKKTSRTEMYYERKMGNSISYCINIIRFYQMVIVLWKTPFFLIISHNF